MRSPGVEVVVARYAEDVSWIDRLCRLSTTSVIVYDKNDKSRRATLPSHVGLVNLPNVGRESHTYLYHIIENWDGLADVTIFVPCSWPSNLVKTKKVKWVFDMVRRGSRTAFPLEPRLSNDVQMNTYITTNSENASANPEVKLHPSPVRPYSAWLAANGLVHGPYEAYQGIFAVSREDIRSRPKSDYERLAQYVSHHHSPEAGHYLERAWPAVFGLYDKPATVHSCVRQWRQWREQKR